VDPIHGIFVERRLIELRNALKFQSTVIAPVPWFPSTAPIFGQYAGFAHVCDDETRSGITVKHPRYISIPKIGMNIAPKLMARACMPVFQQLQKEWGSISLIDAHYAYPDGVAAAMIAKAFDIPLIITARGSDINLIAEYQSPKRQIVQAADVASRLIAVSDALAEKMRSIGIHSDKIVVLPNGVDLEFFSPGNQDIERQRLGLTGPVLLSAGALKTAKGHDIAIELLTRAPDVTLVVAGGGPDEDKLHSLARQLGVQHRVRFTGRIGPSDLLAYYRAADALVLMSEREGMPNVILESLACGTPVIASPVGGIPEMINKPEVGLLVRQRDVDGLEEAWHELQLDLPQADSVRACAKKYSWDRSIQGLKNVILESTD
jgi:glycosyltransferase involved in cell wall biosynthesis